MKIKLLLLPGILLAGLVLLSMQPGNTDQKLLFCHKWRQFAFKRATDSVVKSIDPSMAKTCLFRDDGYYEENYLNIISSGKWFFNADEKKFGLIIDTFNGTKFPGQDSLKPPANIVVLKLTKDTLIYGNDIYTGPNRVYGHDDSYFVRAD